MSIPTMMRLLLAAALVLCAVAAPVEQSAFQAYALLKPSGNYFYYGLVEVWSDSTDYHFVISTNLTTLTAGHLHVIADGTEYVQITGPAYGRNATFLQFSTSIAGLTAANLALTDLYIGLHNDFTLEEIEGDLQTVVLGQHYMAHLSGADVAPTPVVTSGGGVGILFKTGADVYDVHVCWTLDGTIADSHIHQAQWPSQGMHVADLSDTAALIAADVYAGCQVTYGVTALADVNVDVGGYYFNIHSSLAVDGELRGQIAYGASKLICELGVDMTDGFCQFPFGFKLYDAPSSIKTCTDFNGAGLATPTRRRSLEERHGSGTADPCHAVYETASADCLAAIGSYLCTLKCARCDSPYPLNTACQSQCDDVFSVCGSTLTEECKTELDFTNRCSADINGICSLPVPSNGQVPPDSSASSASALLMVLFVIVLAAL